MGKISKGQYLFNIIFLLFFINSSFAQFIAEAGLNQTICPGDNVIIGGAPSAMGGKAPYTYLWSPSTGLSNPTSPNPSASPDDFTVYTLTVTDDTGAVQSDAMSITVSYIVYVNAGTGVDFCREGSDIIGGSNNVTGLGVSYSWAPGPGLNDSTLPQPIASPLITTTYTLTATIAGCPPKIDTVVVTVIQPPPINAGTDITIKEGEVAILQASGGFFYEWSPSSILLYFNTANPDAEPIVNTDYYLYGTDKERRCSAKDTMTVFVEPNSEIVLYNTFTPNKDGNNDTWYIGNIHKYPRNRLEIYNRNGKLVFKANGYLNNWDGKTFLGEELPAATYFYMLDLGEGAGQFHGTVNIVQ
ncbi:MAG: gliding motility-associated C-terminal domain-containing protein [Bacteroidota bacterium]